jgi:hypothetical protein
MSWWDDIRQQNESLRGLAGHIIDTPTSSILEAHRALKDQQDRYAGILRNMEFLGIGGINPAFPLAERAKSLGYYSGSLPDSMSWLTGNGTADLANFSPTYLQSFKTLNEKVAGFSSLSAELRAPAWLGITTSLQDVMTGAFDELLRDRVISQDLIDAATSTFPIPPTDATEPALDAWLDAVVQWFRDAAQMLPAKRKVVSALISLARGIFWIIIAIPIEDKIREPQTRAREQLQAEQFAKAMEQQLDAFAAREQFEARVIKPATVRLEPNSKAQRAGRLAPGTVVRVLSRRGRWYEIEYGDGDIGWVFEKNLERAEP